MSSRSTLRAKGVAATVVLVATVIAVGGLAAAEPGFTPIQAMPVPAASGRFTLREIAPASRKAPTPSAPMETPSAPP